LYKVLAPNIKPPYKFLWAHEYSLGSYRLYRVHWNKATITNRQQSTTVVLE